MPSRVARCVPGCDESKQTLGWTRPKIRTSAAADRWTWLIITAHIQLRLARPLVADLRHPWERPAAPNRLTPARVRRGFRNIRPTTPLLARAPKPGRPGPGRPPGSRNRHPAANYDVGTTVKRNKTITAGRQPTGKDQAEVDDWQHPVSPARVVCCRRMMPAGAFDSSNTCALRGPRGGIVLSSVEYADAVDKGCPAVLGGPLPHVMAAQVAASVRRFVSTGCFVSSSRTRCRSR